MSYSPEEIALARQAAETADTLLPKLKNERLELEQRITWLESHITTYRKMNGAGSVPATAAAQVEPARPARVERGAPKRHFSAIIQKHPDWSNAQLIAAVKEMFGVDYAPSTAYRTLQELRATVERNFGVAH